MEKDRKKTLTISTNLKKKIDTSSISTQGKKSFSVQKKKPFKQNKSFNRGAPNSNFENSKDKKKNFSRNLLSNKQLKILSKKIINPQQKVN